MKNFYFVAVLCRSGRPWERRSLSGLSPQWMPPPLRAVRSQLDASGNCCRGPCRTIPDIPTARTFLTQWSILWDQYNRQRYHYFHCCFDFDRTTFEMQPEWHWANSTAYLRAMMQGFMERLYPYTGDPNTITFLKDFIDYELENGLTPEKYAWARRALSVG